MRLLKSGGNYDYGHAETKENNGNTHTSLDKMASISSFCRALLVMVFRLLWILGEIAMADIEGLINYIAENADKTWIDSLIYDVTEFD